MIDVKKFKERVEKQRDTILSRIKRLRKEDPFSTTDRSLIVEPGSDAAALFGHEQVVVLETKLNSDLKEIERALDKIKKGTYGICEKCGKQISMERLMVKPSAIYCLKCLEEIESKQKKAGK